MERDDAMRIAGLWVGLAVTVAAFFAVAGSEAVVIQAFVAPAAFFFGFFAVLETVEELAIQVSLWRDDR